MEAKQTYSEAHKKYYLKNKEKIAERRKEYSRVYSKSYYETHKKKKEVAP